MIPTLPTPQQPARPMALPSRSGTHDLYVWRENAVMPEWHRVSGLYDAQRIVRRCEADGLARIERAELTQEATVIASIDFTSSNPHCWTRPTASKPAA